MMLAQIKPTTYTVTEYFALEEQSEGRSEYIYGEIFAMAGGTPNHNRITVNVCNMMAGQLVGKPCEPFSSDMRLEVRADVKYTYPDVMVVCQPLNYAYNRKDTLTNPTVIVEVLSKSTRNHDRTTKFEWYQELATLQDYILIDQTRIWVEHFHKLTDGRWALTFFTRLDTTVFLESIQVELPLEQIYQRVDWAE